MSGGSMPEHRSSNDWVQRPRPAGEGLLLNGYWLPDDGPIERMIDYCCPAAVAAYPESCPDHGQGFDVAAESEIPAIRWVSNDDDLNDEFTFIASPEGLPGPLCHYTIDDDGTVHLLHSPQVHRHEEEL